MFWDWLNNSKLGWSSEEGKIQVPKLVPKLVFWNDTTKWMINSFKNIFGKTVYMIGRNLLGEGGGPGGRMNELYGLGRMRLNVDT